MLEPILKGLIEWIYGMILELMSYVSGELLGVMSMDLTYFKTTAPIISDIINVFVALGWALLIGNLVFQALKSMMSGAGFEAEDPKILFLRTFVFSFLLLASQQICGIGLSIAGKVIDLLELPDSINVEVCNETMFSFGGGAKWLLVIIVNVILIIQMIKLLFEIGERYVITSVLTFFSPLAFSMGGSKNTSDIFKGWVRMYCSMLIMMIMNIVFLKLIMSAMSQIGNGGSILVWLVFVVALTRVARKIDSHIGKIGLSTPQTGNPIGGSLTGIASMMAVRVLSTTISRNLSGGKGDRGRSGGTAGRRGGGGRRGARPYTPSSSAAPPVTNYGGSSSMQNNAGSHSSVHSSGSTSSNVNTATQSGVKPSVGKGNVSDKPSPMHTTGATQGTGGIHSGKTPPPVRESVNTSIPAGTQKGAAGGNTLHSTEKAAMSPRPPLPRNTGGTNNDSTVFGPSKSETLQNGGSHTVKGSEREIQKGGLPGSRNTEREVQKGGMPESRGAQPRVSASTPSANVTENRGGNISSGKISVSGTDISYAQSGSIYNTSKGGTHSVTMVSGEKGSVRSGGDKGGMSKEVYSDSHGEAHFGEKSSQYEHDTQGRAYTQYPGRTQVSQTRENHEYKHGRFNPAAANKKSRQTYYQKTITPVGNEAEKERRRKRREDNGKHKR